MIDLDYDNFANVYYSKIAHELAPFEKERQNLWLLLTIITIIVVVFILFLIFVAKIYTHEDSIEMLLFIGFGYFAITGFFVHRFKRKVKNKIYKKLFDIVGLKYVIGKSSEDAGIIGQLKERMHLVCEYSSIYHRHDSIDVDDVIVGDYNGLDFSLSDSNIYYITGSGKNRRRVDVFNGIFIATNINKKFKGETIIKKDAWLQPKTIANKQAVKLEDIEFEKVFEVYSTDQIEARYILTTAFMRRLLDYKKKKKNIQIEMVISNNMMLKENVFLFIHTKKDNFEITVTKSILDKDMFYGVLMDIVDALEIISELKLEQDIGL